MIALLLRFINVRIYPYLAIAFAGMLAAFTLRRGGQLSERNKNLEVNAQAISKRNEVENAVNSMLDESIADRLRNKYSRD